jgi:hypothetical protein
MRSTWRFVPIDARSAGCNSIKRRMSMVLPLLVSPRLSRFDIRCVARCCNSSSNFSRTAWACVYPIQDGFRSCTIVLPAIARVMQPQPGSDSSFAPPLWDRYFAERVNLFIPKGCIRSDRRKRAELCHSGIPPFQIPPHLFSFFSPRHLLISTKDHILVRTVAALLFEPAAGFPQLQTLIAG